MAPNAFSAQLLRLFLPLAAFAIAVSAYLFVVQLDRDRADLKASQSLNVAVGTRVLEGALREAVEDLRILADDADFREVVENRTPEHQALVLRDWVSFVRHKGRYDQIRLIDVQGRERLRVNYDDGNPAAVSEEDLQDKAARYYVADMLQLKPGEIYVSPLDLAKDDRDRIVEPTKPVIRIGVQVLDRRGNLKGLLLLNYLGKDLFNRFAASLANIVGRTMILNSDGHWMLGGERSGDEWAFMFGRGQSFATRYAGSWQVITSARAGQFEDDAGLWTFQTLNPDAVTNMRPVRPAVTGAGKSPSSYWKIVAQIPGEEYALPARALAARIAAGCILLLALAFVACWRVVRSRMQQLQAEAEVRRINRDLEALVASRTEALSESERRYRGMFETSADAILLISTDGHIRDANPAACAMYRYRLDELVGLHGSQFVHPDHAHKFKAALEAIESGRQYEVESVDIRKGGEPFPIDVRISPFVFKGERVLLCAIRDITERRHAEELIRQTRGRFEDLVNSTDGIVWEGDARSLAFTFVSRKAEQMLGYRLEDWQRPGFWMDHLHPSDRQWAMDYAVTCTNALEPHQFEYRFIAADGREVWLHDYVNVIAEDGRPRLRRGIIIDVTERKLAEQALQQRESMYRALFESAMDAIFVADMETGMLVDANRRAQELVGRPLDELLAMHQSALHPPEQLERAVGEFRRAIASKESTLVAVDVVHRDGKRIPVEISSSLATGRNGRTIVFGIFRDLTQRKQVEDALRESERNLEKAQEIAHVGSWQWDFATGKVTLSDELSRIFGLNPGSFHGTAPELVRLTTHPDDLDAVEGATRQALRTHRQNAFSYRVRRPDGTERIVWAEGIVLVDDQGRPTGAVGTVQDITERQRAEEEIRRLNEGLERRVAERTAQLTAAMKELESFSYSVSHDLRTPLRAIEGFGSIIQADYGECLDREGRDYVLRIRRAAQRMAQLIDDLLDLARISRREIRRRRVDLSRLAASVISELRQRDPKRSVDVVIQAGLECDADPGLTRLVIQNLLDNAWKFTSRTPNARIEFGSAETDRGKAFFVRDNGAGFDMGFVNKLFQPFQRLHLAVEYEGTGIGLASVQRIVRRHGGQTWAEGAVERGATFYFTLEP